MKCVHVCVCVYVCVRVCVCVVCMCVFSLLLFTPPGQAGGLESALTLATLTTLATWMLQVLSPTSDSRLSLLLPLSD